jgi:hypothetical protein
MNLEEFVVKYLGKKVDFDGVYGAQCVDLFRQYSKECLGISEHTGSCSTSGGAKDLFLDYNKMPLEKKYFSRETKKSMIQGDILIWDHTDKNQYGHVAIYLGKLNNSLIVFEQNGFTQNGAEINIRSKNNLLGFLRKK